MSEHGPLTALAWRLEWRDSENAPGEWEYEETVDMESEADRYLEQAPPTIQVRAIPLYPDRRPR